MRASLLSSWGWLILSPLISQSNAAVVETSLTTMLELRECFGDGTSSTCASATPNQYQLMKLEPIELMDGSYPHFQCQTTDSDCQGTSVMLAYIRSFPTDHVGGDELKCREKTICVLNAAWGATLTDAERKALRSRRILYIANPAVDHPLTIEGIIFTNGYHDDPGGAIYIDKGTIVILLCNFISNESGNSVSFIYSWFGRRLYISMMVYILSLLFEVLFPL